MTSSSPQCLLLVCQEGEKLRALRGIERDDKQAMNERQKVATLFPVQPIFIQVWFT